MKKLLVILVGVAAGFNLTAQNVSTRTNEFQVDFSDPKKLANSVIPVINWISPTAESNFTGEQKYKIKFEIESSSPIKNIQIIIKESPESSSRGALSIQPETEAEKHKSVIEKSLTLMGGDNLIEIVAENAEGVKTVSHRTIRVGTKGLSDTGKLDSTDYDISFTTTDYDTLPDLLYPVDV